MAKKTTGNIWIDQFKEFAEIVTKARYVASMIYIKPGGQIYAKAVCDYQQIFFQIHEGVHIEAYEETILSPIQIFPLISEIRKTKVEIFMSDEKYLTMINMHPDFMGQTTSIMTTESKFGTQNKEEKIQNLFLDMYTGSSGNFYLKELIDAIQSEVPVVLLNEKGYREFFDNGATYLSIEDNDLIVAKESFPLFSNNTMEFGYKVLDRKEDSRFIEILFIQHEKLFNLYTLMRYRIG